jgi:hypothetical protein
LPHANKEWTFGVWKWVMDFCKEYPSCYPIHAEDYNGKWVYVDISKIKNDL